MVLLTPGPSTLRDGAINGDRAILEISAGDAGQRARLAETVSTDLICAPPRT